MKMKEHSTNKTIKPQSFDSGFLGTRNPDDLYECETIRIHPYDNPPRELWFQFFDRGLMVDVSFKDINDNNFHRNRWSWPLPGDRGIRELRVGSGPCQCEGGYNAISSIDVAFGVADSPGTAHLGVEEWEAMTTKTFAFPLDTEGNVAVRGNVTIEKYYRIADDIENSPYPEDRYLTDFRIYNHNAFDPSKVELTNLYTQLTGSSTYTDVYANGLMQVLLFPTVNYTGESEENIQTQIVEYVTSNLILYEINVDGSHSKVEWEISETSNEFDHDINHLGRELDHRSNKDIHGLRVPIYITVPVDAVVKEHQWYATLGDDSTSATTPTIINVHEFRVGLDDVELLEIEYQEGNVEAGGYQKKAYLHTLKYRDSFTNHTVQKIDSWQGIAIDVREGGNNCRLINNVDDMDFGQAILLPDEMTRSRMTLHACTNSSYPNSDIFYQGYTPDNLGTGLKDVTIGGFDEYLSKLSTDNVMRAWDNGLPIVALQGSGLGVTGMTNKYISFSALPSVFIDNFGNRVEFVIKCDSSHDGGYITSIFPAN
ncbi:hypothetical protein [Vibrio hyugaensis]|uniref:hypothetical protein n=1 Tax=Vibrio hyugaensis TaxID=1534743 RepID=UPI000CE3B317|nr:hypothetical protein [Vibrio hyugaensis]